MTWALVAGQTSRMTGIEFNNNGRVALYTFGIVQFTGSESNGSQLRVDHCKFDHLQGAPALCFYNVIGVVDHNDFSYTQTARAINVFNRGWGGNSYGDGSWYADDGFGSSQFLFIENNTFEYGTGEFYAHIDSWEGGRFVARYNTFTNGWIEAHGSDSGNRYRGCRAVEIYGNTFIAEDASPYVVNMRSGVAVIYNNDVTGYTATPRFEVSCQRMNMSFAPWKGADGSNALDVNQGGGPFGASPFTVTSAGALTASVALAGWTEDEWVGYTIKKTSGISVSGISGSSSTPTVTTTAPHGLTTGDIITIQGANQSVYNISAAITVTGTSTFTYSLYEFATPSATVTGTIIAIEGTDFAEIIDNTTTQITFLLSGYEVHGYGLSFTAGDTFQLWKVNQALDQCGVSGGGLISGDFPVAPVGWNDQTADPSYEWLNTIAGSGDIDFVTGSAVVVEGVNFIQDTMKPGYTAYTYPHPLVDGPRLRVKP